jgi:hypothetical protein
MLLFAREPYGSGHRVDSLELSFALQNWLVGKRRIHTKHLSFRRDFCKWRRELTSMRELSARCRADSQAGISGGGVNRYIASPAQLPYLRFGRPDSPAPANNRKSPPIGRTRPVASFQAHSKCRAAIWTRRKRWPVNSRHVRREWIGTKQSCW